MISDVVVTVAEADELYRPVNRFRPLLRETDQFRFVGFDSVQSDYRIEVLNALTEGPSDRADLHLFHNHGAHSRRFRRLELGRPGRLDLRTNVLG